MPAGTVTVTGASPAGVEALGAGGAGWPHAAVASTTAAQPNLARQPGMHLPHQNLGRRRRGDPLTARGGEPHRVALVELARAL